MKDESDWGLRGTPPRGRGTHLITLVLRPTWCQAQGAAQIGTHQATALPACAPATRRQRTAQGTSGVKSSVGHQGGKQAKPAGTLRAWGPMEIPGGCWLFPTRAPAQDRAVQGSGTEDT